MIKIHMISFYFRQINYSVVSLEKFLKGQIRSSFKKKINQNYRF